jgi:protein-tyrosine phosphatase
MSPERTPRLVDLLVVCTANVARSPLFAARLQLEADCRLGPGVLEVASSGTEAVYGEPAAGGSRTVSARWGRPLEDHHARPLTHFDLRGVPLVLTMEAAHRRNVVSRVPGLAERTFTVREVVRIVRHLSPQALQRLPSASTVDPRPRLLAFADLADAHRPVWSPRRRRDVPDPIGAGQDVYDGLGAEFVHAVEVLAPVLFGPISE